MTMPAEMLVARLPKHHKRRIEISPAIKPDRTDDPAVTIVGRLDATTSQQMMYTNPENMMTDTMNTDVLKNL